MWEESLSSMLKCTFQKKKKKGKIMTIKLTHVKDFI